MSKPNRPRPTPVTPGLAPPDRFISFWSRVGDMILPLLTRLLGLAFVLLIIGAVVWGVSEINSSRHEKATALLSSALRIYQAELLTGDKTPGDSDETPRFKTAKERADATLAALDKLDQEYKSSSAAQRGVLLRAGVHYDQGRFDQAAQAYRQYLDQKPESPDQIAAAREGLGLAVEAQNKLDEALAIFKDQSGLPGDYYKDRLQWAQARVLAKKGDKKAAMDIYKDLSQKAQPPLKDDAQNRLAALENQ